MIQEIRGNALQTEAMIIGQGTNCIGAMGKGFALAVADTWPHVKREFKHLHESVPTIRGTRPNTSVAPSLLGTVQFVGVSEVGLRRRLRPNLIAIANLCIQLEVGTERRRVEYDAVRSSLTSARDQMLAGIAIDPRRPDEIIRPTSLALPRIGAGLSGGDWGQYDPSLMRSSSPPRSTSRSTSSDGVDTDAGHSLYRPCPLVSSR